MKSKIICLGHTLTLHHPSANYDLVEGLTPPHVSGPPPHIHKGYSELFFVLEGSMEFMIDGRLVRVETGESIDLPPNTLHTFRCAGESPCRWLNMHSPKGFLAFFETFGVDAQQEGAFQQSLDERIINQVIQKSAEFDMHIQLSN